MKIKNLILLPMTLVATLILTGCDLLSLPIATEQCEEILQVLALNDEEERTATYHGITKDYSDLYEGSTGAKGQGEEVDGSYKRYDNDVRVNSETSVTWEFAEGNDARVNEEESTTETYTFADTEHTYVVPFTNEVQGSASVGELSGLPDLLNLAQGAYADSMYKTLYTDLYDTNGSLIDSNLTVSLTGKAPMTGGTTTITLKVIDSAFFDMGTIHIDAEMTIKFYITNEKLSGYSWQWFYKTDVDMDGNALGYTYILSEIDASMDISYDSNGDFPTNDLPVPYN